MKKAQFIIFLFILLSLVKGVASAEESVTLGSVSNDNVEYAIVRAEAVNTPAKVFESSEIPSMKLDGYLIVVLELKNNTEKSINYQPTYVMRGPGGVSLEDEFSSHYYRLLISGVSDDQWGILYPGESQKITLAFQKPSPAAKQLTLSFPKLSTGGPQTISSDPQDRAVKISWDVAKMVSSGSMSDHGREDGLVFKIVKAEAKTWSILEIKNELYCPVGLQRQENPLPEVKKEVSMLAITYEFKNNTANQKFELSDYVSFQLSDEFENKYRRYMKPANFDEKGAEDKPEHYPSLYPGESSREIVFFEPPVKAAKSLTLSIDATNIGMQERISKEIPTRDIKR